MKIALYIFVVTFCFSYISAGDEAQKSDVNSIRISWDYDFEKAFANDGSAAGGSPRIRYFVGDNLVTHKSFVYISEEHLNIEVQGYLDKLKANKINVHQIFIELHPRNPNDVISNTILKSLSDGRRIRIFESPSFFKLLELAVLNRTSVTFEGQFEPKVHFNKDEYLNHE